MGRFQGGEGGGPIGQRLLQPSEGGGTVGELILGFSEQDVAFGAGGQQQSVLRLQCLQFAFEFEHALALRFDGGGIGGDGVAHGVGLEFQPPLVQREEGALLVLVRLNLEDGDGNGRLDPFRGKPDSPMPDGGQHEQSHERRDEHAQHEIHDLLDHARTRPSPRGRSGTHRRDQTPSTDAGGRWPHSCHGPRARASVVRARCAQKGFQVGLGVNLR